MSKIKRTLKLALLTVIASLNTLHAMDTDSWSVKAEATLHKDRRHKHGEVKEEAFTPRPTIEIPPYKEGVITDYHDTYHEACEALPNACTGSHEHRLHNQIVTIQALITTTLFIALHFKYKEENWYGSSFTYSNNIILERLLKALYVMRTKPKNFISYIRCAYEATATLVITTNFQVYTPSEKLVFDHLANAYKWENNSFTDLPLCPCILSIMLNTLHRQIIYCMKKFYFTTTALNQSSYVLLEEVICGMKEKGVFYDGQQLCQALTWLDSKIPRADDIASTLVLFRSFFEHKKEKYTAQTPHLKRTLTPMDVLTYLLKSCCKV